MDDQPIQNQQSEEPSITLVDLQNIVSVFDIASSRGAFRAPELESIGQLYNKLKRFVDNAVALNAARNAETSTQEGGQING